MLLNDPIVMANKLSETVKHLAQNYSLTPDQIRKLTNADVVRFYSEHKNISAGKVNG